jgi:mannonate dehydratase
MPRICGCADDLRKLRASNQSVRNGITFCTGSLSGRTDNNLVEIAREFSPWVHFIHLRNTQHLTERSFYESGHLYGSLNMPGIVSEFLKEQRRRQQEGRKDLRMPFRPDHGIRMLTDMDNDIYNAGYPLIGRLRGLAEIDGLQTGIAFSMDK